MFTLTGTLTDLGEQTTDLPTLTVSLDGATLALATLVDTLPVPVPSPLVPRVRGASAFEVAAEARP